VSIPNVVLPIPQEFSYKLSEHLFLSNRYNEQLQVISLLFTVGSVVAYNAEIQKPGRFLL